MSSARRSPPSSLTAGADHRLRGDRRGRENRDAIRGLERLGHAPRGESRRELRFDVTLPDRGGARLTLRGLPPAAASGVLA